MTPFERRLVERGCGESTAEGLAALWLRPGGAVRAMGQPELGARQRGDLELDPLPPLVRAFGGERPERMVARVTRELVYGRLES